MTTTFDSETETAIRARVRALTPESTGRWGKMSVRQMICHLTDALQVALGEVPVVPKWSPLYLYALRAVVVHRLPIPKGKIKTTPEFLRTEPSEWEKDRAAWEAAFDRFILRSKEKSPRWGTHPAFGDLGTEEWGRLTARHFDHHLTQFGV